MPMDITMRLDTKPRNDACWNVIRRRAEAARPMAENTARIPEVQAKPADKYLLGDVPDPR